MNPDQTYGVIAHGEFCPPFPGGNPCTVVKHSSEHGLLLHLPFSEQNLQDGNPGAGNLLISRHMDHKDILAVTSIVAIS